MQKRTSLGWLLVFPALALAGFLLWKYAVPHEPEVEAVHVVLVGRIPAQPDIQIPDAAGTLIVYINSEVGPEEQIAALEDLDDLALLVIEPQDSWMYYFDTLSSEDQLLVYFGMRCPVTSIGENIPWDDRGCQYSNFSYPVPLTSFLSETGFVRYESQDL